MHAANPANSNTGATHHNLCRQLRRTGTHANGANATPFRRPTLNSRHAAIANGMNKINAHGV